MFKNILALVLLLTLTVACQSLYSPLSSAGRHYFSVAESAYNTAAYQEAYDNYEKLIVLEGVTDGVILYKDAYTFEQVYGLTDIGKTKYQIALIYLETKYHSHRFYLAAKLKVESFDTLDSEGRAKTVHVNGYFRKDGTYVRPYYRAPPRRR